MAHARGSARPAGHLFSDAPDPADDLIERGLVAAALAYVRQAGGATHEDPAITWVSTRSPIPFYSGVVRARLGAEDAGRAIESVTAQFRDQGWLMAWWVMPPSRPADLGRRLTDHGFDEWIHDLGMAADLGTIPAAVPVPDGVTVERVQTREAQEEWLRAFGAAYSLRPEILAMYGRLPLGLPPAASRFRYFLARAGGEAVATSLWFPADGPAVIDEVTTVPAMRRRGIGTAVTHAALRDAQAGGYRTAVLTATDAGRGIYQRLGFHAYGLRRIYVRRPDR